MKLVAHIGTPKTGTTSIQRFLDKNRDVLISNGCYFLKSMGAKNNAEFPRCCLGDERIGEHFLKRRGIDSTEKLHSFRTDALAALDDEIKSIPGNIHTVITSSEHFYSQLRTVEEVSRFREIAEKYFSDTRIVVYLRDQADVAVSRYSTELKMGGTRSLMEFVGRHCRRENDYYNYYNALRKWSDVFGRDHLSVRLFNRDEFVNGDLLDDVLYQIDARLIGSLDKDFPVANESLDHVGQVLARCINAIVPQSKKGGEIDSLNTRLIHILSDKFKGKGEFLSEQTCNRIRSEFAESNDLLLKEYLPEKKVLFGGASKSSENQGRILSETQEEGLREVMEAVLTGNDRQRAFSSHSVNVLRDAAIALEQIDLHMASELMMIAAYFKPSGRMINKKLAEYRSRLDACGGGGLQNE